MSGSQHNPNGRQSQLGSGWSPLQVLQMANLLARAPQAHMASDRGVTWHTPTPPPHLYHVPAPSPPDPLQAMKNAGGNSVFRHTATPPELYRHTPTPPDKHLMRHTPSPGDVKAAGGMPPEIYQHLGPGRDQLMVAAARVGVDLTLGSRANGAAPLPLPLAPPPASPALSVRDAPTINSLLGRAGGRRVDSLLGRLAAAPQSPQSPPSVIVPGPRAPPSPSPPSSNEDSADSCGAVVGSKRKRKPERTVRVPAPPAPAHARENGDAALAELRGPAPAPPPPTAPSPAPPAAPPSPPAAPPSPESPPSPPLPTSPVRNEGGSPRRKTRSGSAETIADIAAMIAGGVSGAGACLEGSSAPAPVPLSVDKLQSVLASPEPEPRAEPPPAPAQPPPAPAQPPPAPAQPAAARRAPAATPPRAEPAPAHTTHTTHDPDKDDVTSTECGRSGAGAAAPRAAGGRGPVDSPSEGRAAEPAGSPAPPPAPPAPPPDPPAPSFVEVENQLEKMFAGIEEEPQASSVPEASGARRSGAGGKRRRVSSVGAGRGREAARRGREREAGRRRTPRSKPAPAPAPAPAPGRARDVAALAHAKEGYDSGSNASSSRSRGPYIQIVGPRDSPVSVTVMNAGSCGGGAGAGGGLAGGEEEGEARGRGRGGRRRGLHASTLGLRYDAATRDVTWVCALCLRPPHSDQLGDLFGPYPLDTDCDEYRALDESSRRRHEAGGGGARPEAWLHAECGVWAPGVVASGARLWGLARAVWAAAGSRCAHCPRAGAALACSRRACPSRAHLPCARAHRWRLSEDDFRPLCPAHAQHPP